MSGWVPGRCITDLGCACGLHYGMLVCTPNYFRVNKGPWSGKMSKVVYSQMCASMHATTPYVSTKHALAGSSMFGTRPNSSCNQPRWGSILVIVM
eukprot:3252251-Pleurochrysis_carterae.AAC.3